VVVRIVSLLPVTKATAHAAGEEGIFAVGFLAAAQRGSRKMLMFGAQKVSSERLFRC